MADDFQSQPHCIKCMDEGFINHNSQLACWGEVEICGCQDLNKLESDARVRLRTNKIKPYIYNTDLEIINKIKLLKL